MNIDEMRERINKTVTGKSFIDEQLKNIECASEHKKELFHTFRNAHLKQIRGDKFDRAWKAIFANNDLKRARSQLSVHDIRVIINLCLDVSEEQTTAING